MNQTSSPSSISRGVSHRVAIICSAWHSDIVHKARDAASAEFERAGLTTHQIDLFDVRVFTWVDDRSTLPYWP